MKRLLLNLVLLTVMVLPLLGGSGQVSADKYDSAIGVSVAVDNNVDITYTGKHWVDNKGQNQYEYKARINQAPIYNDDGTLVDCSWHLNKGTYSIINNVFSATVTGSAISTTYQGQTMSWNPVVYVDSKEYTAKGSPISLPVDPINSNYRNNTLEWDYGVCLRHVRVIEGMIQETWIFSKNPKGTVWVKDNTQKSAGFEWDIEPYAYDANKKSLVINQYKQVMASEFDKATYPVIIDPTEVYYTSASDGWLAGYSADWATAHSTYYSKQDASNDLVVGLDFTGGFYQNYKSVVFFDTSALPDTATITSANASLYGQTDLSTNNFDIVVRAGINSTIPHDPITPEDMPPNNWTGNGSAWHSGDYVAGYNNISLNATGISWVSLTGVTKLALVSYQDIINDDPVGHEYVYFWSYEKGAGYRPYLEVIYASVVVPTVTTNPATYVTKTTARLNGYLNADGGSACNVSFNYSLYLGAGNWSANVSTANQSKVTGESFYADLTGLNNSSTYRFIALAGNGIGLSQGLWVNFSTLSVGYEPSNLLCIPSSDSISLSWSKNQSVSTYIRYKVGSYPTGSTDGNMVANQSGGSYTHTGLTPGTSYFYRMWGLENDVLTTNSSTVMCTCTAGNVSGATPVAPTAPDTWFSGTNTSKLEDLPFFEIVTDIGDAGNIPATTWWFMVLLGGVLTGGLVVYSRSKNLFIACILVMALLTVLSIMVLMPMWIVYAFAIASMGLSWKDLR